MDTTTDALTKMHDVNFRMGELVERITGEANALLTLAFKRDDLIRKAYMSGKAAGMLRVLVSDEEVINNIQTLDQVVRFVATLERRADKETDQATQAGIYHVSSALRHRFL
jgi:hypothetical protein